MPQVAGGRRFTAQLRRHRGAVYPAPSTDRLVRYRNAALKHHFLDFAQADIEPEIEPDRAGDDFDREAMVFIGRRHAVHATRLPQVL